MNPLEPFLKHQNFILLDGGLATELENRGFSLNDPLWSAKLLLESPETVKAVHTDYLNAGADIIATVSYQANLPSLQQRGLSVEEAIEAFALSYRLADSAVEEFWESRKYKAGRLKPLVAASIGPYGAYLADGSEYKGDYTLDLQQLKDFHRPRMEALWNAGARFFAFETIPSKIEAKALASLLEEFRGSYAWLSFSCKDDKHISTGMPLKEAALVANESSQIVAVGVNCTPPQFAASLLNELGKTCSMPLLAYPNRGYTWDAGNHCWIPGEKGNAFSKGASQWLSAGARIIGGCCKTTPQDIQEMGSLKTWIDV